MSTSMSTSEKSTLLGKRYRLGAEIGAGGMGVVYRATDLLTGEPVALKRVLTDPSASVEDSINLRQTMAREFATLASLRHPNIVSVLDYGFDAERQPFFTMELLESPQMLTSYGEHQPLSVQIELLVHVLRALVYLHRRRILHRDLKPANVLVSGGHVKVLDFGLASAFGQDNSVAGTLAYIAPEVLLGEPAGESADLYAVGVMAYELLAGVKPFHSDNAVELIDMVIETLPDMTRISADPAITRVIECLLAKDPKDRYPNADAVIDALRAATGHPVAAETASTRESFLQAAQFVGRERETLQLMSALEGALNGHNSTWLVGGESGVGKSRLIGEIRTAALIRGMVVITGQAVTERGTPFSVWRNVARRLLLNAGLTNMLTDIEAGTLKRIASDVERLLERDIPDVTDTDARVAQLRLFGTVNKLIEGHTEPLLIVLEDLQWADNDSLRLLDWVTQSLKRTPVLIIGTFRDDERGDLPERIEGANSLLLKRLSESEIAALSESMLGAAGKKQPVLELLQRETEGNVFFLVEIVRALAEEAGELDLVGSVTLPEHVITGGVQNVVQCRLSRVPADDRSLLEYSAVIGRMIDVNLLRTLDPHINIEEWLATCSGVAVLEAIGENWHFAHDKLRESVLAWLDADRRRTLHKQVAEAIEKSHAQNLSTQYARLAYHYQMAGLPDKERVYAQKAGDHAAKQYANADALTFYDRVLTLTPEDDLESRYSALNARLEILDRQGERDSQHRDLNAMEHIANALNDDTKRAIVAVHRAEIYHTFSESAESIKTADVAVELSKAIGSTELLIRALLARGKSLNIQAAYDDAVTTLNEALALSRAHNLKEQEGRSLMALGATLADSRNLPGAKDVQTQAVAVFRELGNKLLLSQALNVLAIAYRKPEEVPQASGYLEEALKLAYETGDRQSAGRILNNLGSLYSRTGDLSKEMAYYVQSYEAQRGIKNERSRGILLYNTGAVAMDLGDYRGADGYFAEVYEIFSKQKDRQLLYHTQRIMSQSLRLQGRLDEALDMIRKAIDLANEINNTDSQADAMAELAYIHLERKEVDKAEGAFNDVHRLSKQLQPDEEDGANYLIGMAHIAMERGDMPLALERANNALAYLEKHNDTRNGALADYLLCYHVLKAANDPRAVRLVDKVYHILQNRAASISDETMRRMFLENVAVHREWIALWDAL
jgi:tetratricopeptide (TPR) repeat protein